MLGVQTNRRRYRMTTDTEVQKVFEEFWQPIVMPDGEWDLEQVKKELSDHAQFMDDVSKVYCHVTDGAISKVNTHAEAVIGEADEVVNRLIREAIENERDSRLNDPLA